MHEHEHKNKNLDTSKSCHFDRHKLKATVIRKVLLCYKIENKVKRLTFIYNIFRIKQKIFVFDISIVDSNVFVSFISIQGLDIDRFVLSFDTKIVHVSSR